MVRERKGAIPVVRVCAEICVRDRGWRKEICEGEGEEVGGGRGAVIVQEGETAGFELRLEMGEGKGG